jgi:hypothetical protein
MRPFGKFAFTFTKKFLFSVYSLAGIISTLLTYVRLPDTLHKSVPFFVLALFLISAYRAAWIMNVDCERQTEILRSQLDEREVAFRSEIEAARKRPYDDNQRNLLGGKISGMTARERDLLRLLLQRGATDTFAVRELWLGEKMDADQLLNVLKSAGLVTVRVEQTQNAAKTLAMWEVNATCAEVLKDLLYPRTEPDPKPYFRF